MKRLDWFVADKELSKEVAEFMRCYVWKVEINLKYKKLIDDAKADLAKTEDPDRVWINEDLREAVRVESLAKIALYEKQRDAEIAEQAKFELSENAKTLKRGLAKDSGATADVFIRNFFRKYHIEVEGTGLVDEILRAAGEKIDNKTLVATNGEVATAFNAGNCFKMVYAKAYEHMVYAGTIKAQQIPELMMEKYTKIIERKAAKKAKKEAKAE